MATQLYRARWIIPVAGPPIRDGVLAVHNGRIVESTEADTGEFLDLGDAVIIPALVNAHTHLEFSALRSPLGEPGMEFTDWIKRVVAWRRSRDDGWDTSQGASPPHVAAIRAGIDESLRAGTSLIGEIATVADSAAQLQASDARGVAFWEVIGWSSGSIAPSLERARAFLSHRQASKSGIVRGVSPHAPYTVHQDLLRAIVRESARCQFPIAMHLAETEAELMLMASGLGPFAEMLQSLSAWDPTAIIPRSRPREYLQILAEAEKALIIHGNYLDEGEIHFLAEHRSNMSVVYCPRTHDRFCPREYPIHGLLAVGARIALGTDSRASTPDLSVLSEMRFAAERHQDVPPETWLQMATLNGAAALGLDTEYGSLEPGKFANFLVIPLERQQRNNPWSWMYEWGSKISDVYSRGSRFLRSDEGKHG